MSDYVSSVESYLFNLTRYGIKLNLNRVKNAAADLGNPQYTYNTIHVAGTNGKGSTCTYIASILNAAGLKTGLFTSPHLVRFEERFKIDNKIIDHKELTNAFYNVKQYIEKYQLTFFEAAMIIACELFRMMNVQWAVFETGMGGRLDATNIIKPKVSVITSIGLDHQKFLGNTIEKITDEKMGIIKENTPVIIAQPNNTSLYKYIINKCNNMNVSSCFVNKKQIEQINESISQTQFIYNKKTYTISMQGTYQLENVICALAAVEKLPCTISYENIFHGLKSTYVPGRFQKYFKNGKTIVFDVAHNPDATDNLCLLIDRYYSAEKICVIAGIMKDKDYRRMLHKIESVADCIIVTKPNIKRAADVEALAECVHRIPVIQLPNVNRAIEVALERIEQIICITGSFYTVGEAMNALDILP